MCWFGSDAAAVTTIWTSAMSRPCFIVQLHNCCAVIATSFLSLWLSSRLQTWTPAKCLQNCILTFSRGGRSHMTNAERECPSQMRSHRRMPNKKTPHPVAYVLSMPMQDTAITLLWSAVFLFAHSLAVNPPEVFPAVAGRESLGRCLEQHLQIFASSHRAGEV